MFALLRLMFGFISLIVLIGLTEVKDPDEAKAQLIILGFCITVFIIMTLLSRRNGGSDDDEDEDGDDDPEPDDDTVEDDEDDEEDDDTDEDHPSHPRINKINESPHGEN